MKILLIAILIITSAFIIAYFMNAVRLIYSKEKITIIQMFAIMLISFAIVVVYLLVLTRVLDFILY